MVSLWFAFDDSWSRSLFHLTLILLSHANTRACARERERAVAVAIPFWYGYNFILQFRFFSCIIYCYWPLFVLFRCAVTRCDLWIQIDIFIFMHIKIKCLSNVYKQSQIESNKSEEKRKRREKKTSTSRYYKRNE